MRTGLITNMHCVLLGYSFFGKVLFEHSKRTGSRMLLETNISRMLVTKGVSAPIISQSDILEDNREKQRRTQRARKNVGNFNSLSKEIREYLSAKESLSNICDKMPHTFLKRRKSHEALYVVDDEVAKQFVDAVKSTWNLEDDHIIIEGNPGLGFFSNELIEAGVKRLLLYESCSDFHPALYELQERYPDVVKISQRDIFSIWRLAFQDKMDNGSRVAEILSQLPERKWTDDPVVKIIGALPTLNFIKHLIRSIVFQTGIMMHGRPELYLALPPYLFVLLTCGTETNLLFYRATSVLFQFFFEAELLTKVPRKAFFPWDAEIVYKKHNIRKIREKDSEYLYVVKVVPKKDLFETVAPVEKLQPLWYFVVHHFIKRRNRVIPELERWVPGCGPRLILQGMNIFTKFGDLTPQEVLVLFQEFSSWPEYPHSPFLASMETMFLKMEQTEEDVDKDLAESEIDNLQSSIPDEEELSASIHKP